MNMKAFFLCGGGSNLILGTGRENQIFFLRTRAILPLKLSLTVPDKGICIGVHILGPSLNR